MASRSYSKVAWMQSDMRIVKWVLLFLFLLMVFVAVYVVFVSLSERREYYSPSLVGYFLTPGELLDMSSLCADAPVFVYSSADGPKPTVVIMNCIISKHDFEQHIELGGFEYLSEGLFRKAGYQVQVTTNPDSAQVTSVAFIGSG